MNTPLFSNLILEHEKDVCLILSKVSHFIHPDIVSYIQKRNKEEYSAFSALFKNRIDIHHYLYEGSACVFPGIRRWVGNTGIKKAYNETYRAIIDDNTFPRHLWCFLAGGRPYNGDNWKKFGFNQFELAHIYSHKESQIDTEHQLFESIDQNLKPYGDFTCACNVALLPKGMVKPTDKSPDIKAVFFKRYIELYGYASLNGRHSLVKEKLPVWHDQMDWIDPVLPKNWKDNIELLLTYRTQRITKILIG